LQANAQELQSNTEIIANLEQLVSDRLGARVRHRRAETIVKSRPGDPRPAMFQRSYTTHWFEPMHAVDGLPGSQSGGHIAVFVKAATRQRINPELEGYLREHSGHGFRVPYFYGVFEHSGLKIAAWEKIEGNIKAFRDYSASDKNRVVKAIAAVNSLRPDNLDVLRRMPSWLDRPKEWVDIHYTDRRSRGRSEWDEIYVNTIKVIEAREPVLLRLQALGENYLTHNDVSGSFVVPNEGDVVLFDWEVATRNVAGADLAFTVGARADHNVLSSYISEMAEHGIELKAADVRFAMELLRGFEYLRIGWKKENTKLANRGLQLLASYIGSPPGKSQAGQSVTSVAPDSAAIGAAFKPPSEELVRAIRDYAQKRGGALYAAVPHPAFSDIPFRYGPERFDMIVPHLDYRGGTALDIGANWGHTSHRLEDLGYQVTAVELNDRHAWIMKELRDICGKKFNIVHGSIFDLQELEYDVVIAQNIFHHFLKKQETFAKFEAFLHRLKCKMMIYQAHSPTEEQMEGAHRGMTPEEMTEFLSRKLSLPTVTCIGVYGRRQRKLFKLSV
jgi:2-polyprenyl-3-methyl-5-hydroxy-6-metoxy-1,4-benzoquinol methylase